MARALIFLVVTIAYAGVWLALAMLFSIVFRSTATAALVTLGLWLFLSLLWPALAPAVVAAFAPTNNEETLPDAALRSGLREDLAPLPREPAASLPMPSPAPGSS